MKLFYSWALNFLSPCLVMQFGEYVVLPWCVIFQSYNRQKDRALGHWTAFSPKSAMLSWTCPLAMAAIIALQCPHLEIFAWSWSSVVAELHTAMIGIYFLWTDASQLIHLTFTRLTQYIERYTAIDIPAMLYPVQAESLLQHKVCCYSHRITTPCTVLLNIITPCTVLLNSTNAIPCHLTTCNDSTLSLSSNWLSLLHSL